MSKLPDPRTIIVALVIVSTTIYSAYSPWFVCALGGFAAVMLASAAINPNTLVRPSWVAVYLATFAVLGGLVFVIPLVWKSTVSAFLEDAGGVFGGGEFHVGGLEFVGEVLVVVGFGAECPVGVVDQ